MSSTIVPADAFNGIVKNVARVSDTEADVTFKVVAPKDRIDNILFGDTYNQVRTSGLDGQPSDEPAPPPPAE